VRSAARYRRRLAREQDAASVYRALARQRAGEEREILLALARAEERHAAHWAAKLHPAERAPRRHGVRARTLGWLARRLGSLVVLGLVQRAEAAGDYDRDPEATATMAADEAERRAAALLAGSEDQPAGGDDADPDAAGADVAGPDVVGSAVGAAGFSFVAFAAGAAIPILPFLVTTGAAAIAAAAVIVGVALFATGTTVGLLTGGPLLRRGLRQLGIGAAAAVVTYWLGRLFGTAIG
jgi:VIT family